MIEKARAFCVKEGMIALWALIGLGIGIIAGALDFVFASGLQLCTQLRREYLWLLVPFLALAGVLIVWLYRRFGRHAQRGMSLVFALAQGDEQEGKPRLIPLLTFSTWLSHLFGGSVGREGVAVQINAMMAQFCARWIALPDASRMLTLTGMAAGFGGLFQTPLAATFFALEVVTPGRLRLEALAPALSASFSACLCSGMLGLRRSVFAFDLPFSLPLLGPLALSGIAFGLCGMIFSAALAAAKRWLAQRLPRPDIRIFFCGALLSMFILLLHQGRYAGLGTNLIEAGLNGGPLFWYDWLVKGALTVFTLSAGFQGGEVTPLFSIGAALGALLGPCLGLPAAAAAALGYASVFGAASNTLLAPILIGAELFGLESLPCFMICAVCAYLANGGCSIYPQRRESGFSGAETAISGHRQKKIDK